MNLIIQHWNGRLPEWAVLAKKTISQYAKAILADYELVQGMPLGKGGGPHFQKMVMLDERYDLYDNVLILDMDTIATKVMDNVFDCPEIGVLHGRAMKGKSLTPRGSPSLYRKGFHVFFGNFIKLDRDSRKSLRNHFDPLFIEKEIVCQYAADEIAWHYLFYKSQILQGKRYEDICMRTSGTSHQDIHHRKYNRYDRKFCNLPEDSDKNASLIHFCRQRKKSIKSYVKQNVKWL